MRGRIDPERPLWLLHHLGFGRCFWACWTQGKAFLEGLSPSCYATSELLEIQLREQLLRDMPESHELEAEPSLKEQIYRRIRRAELPAAVREQIATALHQQRQVREEAYAELGFGTDDLQSLDSLRQRFRVLAYGCHPDHGGNPEHFQTLQQAYQQARLRLQASASRMR
ncbi:MAG: hypothetical protein ACO1RX_15425 [Candidatus Sericytochromatia bacterium]